ncbi:MAG: hypothetical protein WHS83_17510 [Chloroflexus sp.]|uniref:hypothetical protein n=1 Tax=Chloroflexus sp. TaxID=1904827 RepID=UPI00309C7F37
MEEKQKTSVERVWQWIATFLGVISGLTSLILQIVAWSQDAQTLRYVSLAPFLIALATAVYFAHRAWDRKRGGLLVVMLSLLFLIGWGYAFLWGIWLEPYTPGCANYALRITSPLDDSTIRGNAIEVRGTLTDIPPAGSIVVLVRSQDGALNWPQFTPIGADPMLGVWKGSANILAGKDPLKYRIAIAFVGKSGRALLALYQKMGQETGQWPGIEFLPDDIQICDEVTIMRTP